MVAAMTVAMLIVVSVAVVVVLVLTVVMPVIVPVLFVHFIAAKMLIPAHVPTPIGPLAASRKRASVTEAWIELAIYVSVKAFGTMKPGSGTDEDSSDEPLRSVVAQRSAGIWGVIKVTVWANRGHSDVDRYLRSRLLRTPYNTKCGKSYSDTKSQSLHQALQIDR
jgi:hypothetical protein